LPAPASANALALLRFPDRRTAWVVVVAATLAAPADRLEERLAGLHRAVPMIGARLHGETWYPGPPPEPVIVDGDPLAAPELVARFDLAAQPPLRVVAGSGGTRLAVACHHAAFDGPSLVALLATLVRPQSHPDDLGQLGPPQPPTEAAAAVEGVEAAKGVEDVEGVDNREHPSSRSATLPLRGPEPRGPGLEPARDLGGSGLDREPGPGPEGRGLDRQPGPEGRGFDRGFGPWGAGPDPATAGGTSHGGRRSPELRGLVGRLIRPADRVAPSLARPGREALAVAEVDLAGPGVTSRLVSAAVAAAGAHNARLGRPWRRVGINIGLAAAAEAAEGRASIGTSGGERPGGNRTSGGGVAADRAAGAPSAANRTHQTEVSGNRLPGNFSRYRRIDLGPAEAVAPALEAALASSREPLDQVWSPRWGWVLEPVVGRFSDSLLVSNLGRREVPGVTRLEFFPVARGRSAVAVGAVGLAGGPATVSVRARDLSSEDAEVLLADLVACLEAGA
jgi:hypothetical protein